MRDQKGARESLCKKAPKKVESRGACATRFFTVLLELLTHVKKGCFWSSAGTFGSSSTPSRAIPTKGELQSDRKQ